MKEDKGYNGFWKHLGCTLAIIALLVFIGIIVSLFYVMFTK